MVPSKLDPRQRKASDPLLTLGDLVEARTTKLLLSVLIVISVLPFPWVDERLLPLFLSLFGGELLARGLLHHLRPALRQRGDTLFLLLALLAFLSFVPLSGVVPLSPATWTLLRLLRLLALLRFVRDVARDVYLIMTRREQLQQFGLITGAVFLLSLVSAALLAQLSLLYRDDGRPIDELGPLHRSQELGDQLWWAFRQLESGDNLWPQLKGPWVLWLISLCMTIVGVFIISFIIGIGTNVVEQVVRAERRRKVEYRDHSLVIGPLEGSEHLVREFVRLYDKNRQLRRVRPRELWRWLFRGGPMPRRHALPRMALLGPSDDAPPYLHEPLMRWVVYRQGSGADEAALEMVSAGVAKRVILLAHTQGGPDADAMTLASLSALRESNPHAHVFVEQLESESGPLLSQVGGPGTFPLDVPRFAGLFLCQHLLTPGVSALYRELLTADGSEFYTHIFHEAREIAALERMAQAASHVRFLDLWRAAYEEHHVVLVGVFLGEGIERGPGSLIPIDRLVRWINPHQLDADPRVEALGGRPGQVPLRTLRGLIGISQSYLPLRSLAHALLRQETLRAGAAPSQRDLPWGAARVEVEKGELRRVLLIGFSTALPALLAELSRFVPDLDALLFLGARGDEQVPLRQRLERLGLRHEEGEPLPGLTGRRIRLERGGQVTVYTHEGGRLVDFALGCLSRLGPVEAAVFLSEPDTVDRDARIGMRVLSFARAIETGQVPRGERLHILAEFMSLSQGERVAREVRSRCLGFAEDGCVHMTPISTDQIKSYFMVHSAFVPGVTALYDELLARHGQDIVRLPLPAPARRQEVSLAHIHDAMVAREVIPIAVETERGEMLLNPPPRKIFDAARLRALYAIGRR